jgi:c(7)-type cytochrome triheme protein
MNKHKLIIILLLFATALLNVTGAAVAEDNPNVFNRLFVPPKDRGIALKDDEIHDPSVPGLSLLQQPKQALGALPGGIAGNYVDWVKAIEKGKISPRFDYLDPDKQAMPMDLVIVMEVKGSMPNVAFPHKQHTDWLECANCHDAIFKPQKGANPMSMAEIMLGQKCGVCHGSVAFPVTECRRCHTESKKTAKTAARKPAKK